jgi:hypothetical protein
MIAGLTVLVWRSTLSATLRSATLLSGTLVAVPLALVYDKIILLVVIVWLLARPAIVDTCLTRSLCCL